MRLSTLYPTLSTEQREALANAVGSDTGYLWQLATRWRGKRASMELMGKLAQADSRLTLADMAEEFTEPAPVDDGEPAQKVAG